MQIRTSTTINTDAGRLWPLLTNSRMDLPGFFCFGIPRPVSCELPQNNGGIGSERRCISDQGIVIQKITNWIPSQRLQFEMVSTDHRWGSMVESIKEDFLLQESGRGTCITRTTHIEATRPFKLLKEIGFYLGLKRVHHYVFKNWRAKTEQDAAANP